MPGAPTPTGVGVSAGVGAGVGAEDGAVPARARSSPPTTSATAAATWLPTMLRVPFGVATRASATMASEPSKATPRTLVPPMSMP